MVISDVYMSFISNKTFTNFSRIQWISPGALKIKAVSGEFMGLAGLVNATVYITEPFFTGLGDDKLS